jgi:hypothetical protein
MDKLAVAASVLETADDDDFEDEEMVEVNPGDPGPPETCCTPNWGKRGADPTNRE